MTAPVVVDPAPPDLATGLDALARAAGAARVAGRPLLLVAADLQVHAEALADLAEDPRPATAALVSAPPNSIVTSDGMGTHADSSSMRTKIAR